MDKKSLKLEQEFVRPQVEKGKPVFVKNGYELLAICPEDVVCIMASGNNCQIYLKDKKQPEIVSRTYCGLMETCIGNALLQIRRGTSINIFYLKKIIGTEMILKNGISVNISQNHIKELLGLIKII